MKTKTESFDDELLVLLSQGDHAAFQALFDQWWDTVYSTAFIYSKSVEISQDIAQEAFLYVWKERDKMIGVNNFRTYMISVARNMIFRRLSRIKLEEAYKRYLEGRVNPYRHSTQEHVDSRETYERIQLAVNLLPPRQQQAYRLSREQGLSHDEIAAQMGVNKLVVKDYIVRALAFLRQYLQNSVMLLIGTLLAIIF